ncbi:MAG: flotillin family protein [Gloeomargaritaceae cyanobacterium C42_A2020_066]|nr:flotillin family protein [Gloeomargaritaceae cyanobacterium C42_A2020_066]
MGSTQRFLRWLGGTALGVTILSILAGRPGLAQTAPLLLAQVGPSLGSILSLAGFVVILLITALVVVKQFIFICCPNEILIFAGRKHRSSSGQSVGYRVVFGGVAFRTPILESVERMDLTTMPVQIEVKSAYSSGGTPLHIQAIANIKISSNPRVVGNAIERFLGRKREEIIRVAKETLEGNLRGVVATLTPEQVNEDRLQFADRISQDVNRDMTKLGLQLDTLKVQSVADDVDYLSSIGRRRIAQIVRDAEIAESNAQREAAGAEAESRRQAEVAQRESQAVIQQRQNELRKVKADLDREAHSEEERTEAAAQEARALAELDVQRVRADLERLRLQADEVLPAEAEREAQAWLARGQAAILAEKAQAAAQVNTMLAEVWQAAGQEAAAIFLIQQMDTVLGVAAQIPAKLKLQRIHTLDRGDGQALVSLVRAYPEVVRQFLHQVDGILGLDIMAALHRPAPADSLPSLCTPSQRPQPSQEM